MDKMQNYLYRQGFNKALVVEPRKSDNLPHKATTRNGKRRENTNSTNFKNDNNQRNYNCGKFRANFDKRPKAKNHGGISTNSAIQSNNLSPTSSGLTKEQNGSDNNEFEFELNSIYNPGSKKHNLNHLLNFHYNSRENDRSGLNIFGRSNGNRTYAKKSKYNKEQYLQANFQFVIKSEEKIRIDVSSPDTLVDWSLIEQINIQTTEEPQCPICLYPPIAAKLTRCGHVYCWPCILHYLALSDKTWRKCPICYEAVHIADLKSTSIIEQKNFKIDDSITFQLMRRKKGTIFVDNQTDKKSKDQFLSLSDSSEMKKFSKFLLANPIEVLKILEKERKELLGDEELICLESVFVQQALDLLKERKMKIATDLNVQYEDLDKLIALDETVINKDLENINNTAEVDKESVDEDIIANTGAVQKDSKYYYFYQSVDAQNIFMHPLNIKMLQAMYSSLEKAPVLIKAKILQKDVQTMNDEHRKKFTCLGHLPLTCQFEIVEVDLKPPIVSKDILKMFQDDIMLREKIRQRRDRDEKKREKEIDEINDRQIGKLIHSSANIDMKSAQQFPVCGFEEPLHRNSFGELSSYTSELSDSPPNQEDSRSVETFANILSSPKKEFWPSLEASNINNINVDSSWARTVKCTSPQIQQLEHDCLNKKGNDLSDVLAKAFERKTKIIAAEKSNLGGNKKSKKNKKTLLFSSGMNFGGN